MIINIIGYKKSLSSPRKKSSPHAQFFPKLIPANKSSEKFFPRHFKQNIHKMLPGTKRRKKKSDRIEEKVINLLTHSCPYCCAKYGPFSAKLNINRNQISAFRALGFHSPRGVQIPSWYLSVVIPTTDNGRFPFLRPRLFLSLSFSATCKERLLAHFPAMSCCWHVLEAWHESS